MAEQTRARPRRGAAGIVDNAFPGGNCSSENAPKADLTQAKFATSISCICGIDPGLSGAIAFYFPEIPDRVVAEDMPVAGGAVDCATLAARIVQMAPDLAVVERVGAMPQQGVASTFKFGAAYGALHGILAALKIRMVLVTPQVWKKHFRLDSDKEKSRALALRTFSKSPQHFARKKDDGRAEAALLAVYGAYIENHSRLSVTQSIAAAAERRKP